MTASGNRPQIIYLNGPSSSGKSTLAKALQDALNPPYLHIGIDKIIGMMPEKVNNWTGGVAELGYSWRASSDPDGHRIQELQIGPFSNRISSAYKKIVVLLLELGHQLIVDDVAFGHEDLDRWKNLLNGFSVLYVGIKTPLDVLELREKNRGNRILGSARAQYFKAHNDTHYDLDIDTSLLSTDECVARILEKIQLLQKDSLYPNRPKGQGLTP